MNTARDNYQDKERRVADRVSEPRLQRIESKLDEMHKAIVSMARLEERNMTLFNRMDAYDARQQVLLDRVAELEKSAMTIKAVEKGTYIVGSAVVASIFWFAQQAVGG